MANRVEVNELKEILDTELSDPALVTFISVSNRLVTSHLGSEDSLSAAQLKDIELFLAAHIIACTIEQQVQKEQVGADGEAQVTYQGQTGKGLDFTGYGQTVKMLDTTGILANVVGKSKATVYAVTSFSGDTWP